MDTANIKRSRFLTKDQRNLVRVLQSELIFLDAGGYSAWAGARWRLPLVFEESPTCPNFNDTSCSVPCRNCVLMQLVPLRHRENEVPCRAIPLTPTGETLNTLYRWGNMDDLQRVMRSWLIKKITDLQAKEARVKYLKELGLYRAAELT